MSTPNPGRRDDPGTHSATAPQPAEPRGRAVIYTRTNVGPSPLAREEQAHQLRACREEAAVRRFDVVAEVHDIGMPGTLKVHRPGWAQVVEMIRAGQVDLVVSADFARITRCWSDVAELMALARTYGVDFHTAGLSLRDRHYTQETRPEPGTTSLGGIRSPRNLRTPPPATRPNEGKDLPS